MSNNAWNTVLEPVGPAASPIQDRSVLKNEVSPQWFSTYGIPVIAGRDFSVFDQRSPQAVVIVNETLARRYFDGDPVGRSIREVGGPGDPQPDLTIVGVARDAVYTSLREGPPATMYLPSAHAFGPISVRAESESPAYLIQAVIAAITDIDGDLELRAHLLADDFSAAVARERMLAVLAALFGGLALLLAGVGLYGVVSYGVGARRTEIGIRISLGCKPGRRGRPYRAASRCPDVRWRRCRSPDQSLGRTVRLGPAVRRISSRPGDARSGDARARVCGPGCSLDSSATGREYQSDHGAPG